MRLLNTSTLQFKEFFDADIPEYVILSHRWGYEKVSFKLMRKGAAPPNSGLEKIERFCQEAKVIGLKWGWVDTCCIDQRSSAELSEAINSMFKWYANAKVCLVHLSDVQITPKEFACRSVNSYGIFWDDWIGARYELRSIVAEATTIDVNYLSHVNVLNASVAKKMSYASRRKTSREEDIAYCLLGLFNVKMPLLYGEGAERAFKRLQIEIMKESQDESLFAWTSDQPASGMLADDIAYFQGSGRIVEYREVDSVEPEGPFDTSKSPFAMTSRGLEFPIPEYLSKENGLISIPLKCSVGPPEMQERVWIELCKHGDSAVRSQCGSLKVELYSHSKDSSGPVAQAPMQILYVKRPTEVDIEYVRLHHRVKDDSSFAPDLMKTAKKKIAYRRQEELEGITEKRWWRYY